MIHTYEILNSIIYNKRISQKCWNILSMYYYQFLKKPFNCVLRCGQYTSEYVWNIAHVQEIQHPGTLPATLGTYILYTGYGTCFSAFICWYLKHVISNQIFFPGHFTNFPYNYICEVLTLCSHMFGCNNMIYYWLSC